MPPRIHTLPAAELLKGAKGSRQKRAERLQNLPHCTLILGVDPGLHRTGYGLIRLDDKTATSSSGTRRSVSLEVAQLVDAGILRARATDPLSVRLLSLHDGLREVVLEHQPDVMVVEELFSTYAHPRSALLMAHARGALLLAASQLAIPVHHFLPNEVKQVLTGNGHSSKHAVQSAVQSRLRLSVLPEPADVADALALALCFAVRQQHAR